MSTKLKSLSDRHYTAIRMKIEGYTATEMAEVLGTSNKQIYLWFSDPLVKDELLKQRARIFDMFAERLTDLTMRAFHRLEEMADMPLQSSPLSTDQKLEIIREILDRNPMTQKQAQGALPTRTPPVPEGITDQELIDQFRAVAASLPAGVIDGNATSVNGSPDG